MKLLSILLAVASLSSATVISSRGGKVNYNGYKVFRVDSAETFSAVEKKFSAFSALPLHGHDGHWDIAVSPEKVEAFETSDINASLLSEDLGAEIASEGEFQAYEAPEIAAIPPASWFDAYHSYNDHLQFFRDLQTSFPSNSEIITAGTSVQGRQITGIHLWGSGGKGSKPAVYFHGTVHAREWITTMVVEYIAYQLVVGYGNDTTVKGFLDKYDFYILPVVNPDGFVYSQTTDRLWRKNRQTRSGTSAVGTDINRNWPYKWELTGGASTSPSAEDYKGQAAGDTPENRGLVAFTSGLRSSRGIKLYIDWHSYGQYILLPFGYSCSARAANHARQLSLATSVSGIIAQPYGRRFTYGPSCPTLYPTTGSSVDYLTDVGGAEFAWTIELRGGGSGTSGFILPANQILPSGIEQWEGLKYLLQNM